MVQFILGCSGSGKTSYILEEIREKISAGGNAPLYYLVPEQFSLQSEKLLLDGTRQAVTQVQVLSFNRLAHRLFSMLGGPPGQHADDLGKQMLLRKVLFEVELEYYKSASDKHGFINELSHTITEMNHYRVSADDLTDRAAHSSPTLAAKLRDTAKILTKYRDAVKGRYLLTDEMPELLCKKLDEFGNQPLPLLDGAYFWVDEFTGFTPQERQVLSHIIKRAAKVTFTLTVNDKISQAPRETMEKLEILTKDILPHIYIKKNLRHANAKGLAFFVENFGASQKISQEHDGIEIISAADRYSAVYAAAYKVLQLVSEGGHRFRDIAVLCGDRSQYEKILHNVFDRLQIPMFVDTETDILSHPLTEMIRAALDIPVRNYSYETVFRFLKTRLCGISPDVVDILENYALANGINSYRWRYAFREESAEEGRRQFLDAISVFEKLRADSVDTVKNYSRLVFEMLYAQKVPETLQAWFEKHMRDGDPATARLHAQIWPKLCEVFDKLVDILGDEKVTLKTFGATLDAGLVQVGLGRIPPTLDQIVLGDITRSRYPQIKTMLVLGANDGVFPKTPTAAGLLTDYERRLLKNSALELAPDNFKKVHETNFNLYCALSQPGENLIFIYAEAEPNGKPLRVSSVITKIRKMFPNLETKSAPVPAEIAAENSIFFAPVTLSRETVRQLYGETIHTAATRLEAFGRCPFAYYMNYILGAKPRKLYEVLPSDLGKLFHDVIAEFTKKRRFDLSRAEIFAVVDEMTTEMNSEDSIFHRSARNKHILAKVRSVAAASCWAICEQIKNGQYSPSLIEHEILTSITLENGKSLSLHGRVDRVDAFEDSLKIIDYKTGGAKFSMDEALKGVQLQLMLYMNALTNSRGQKTPGGVFYFPIDDPIINTDEILSDAARDEALLKCFKMSGIEINDKFDMHSFKTFGGEIENKVKELGEKIYAGNIIAQPYTHGPKSPCKYCKFPCGGNSS